MTALVLVVSLLVVTVGAELLVRGASLLALRAGLSSLFVGLTVVGMGTSSPELAASIFAAWKGTSEVCVGNVVGSNLFNVCVILGVTALVRPIRVEISAVRRDLWIAVAASCLPFLALAFGGRIGPVLGASFVIALVAWLAFSYRAARRAGQREERLAEAELERTFPVQPARRWKETAWFQAGLVAIGLVALILGSRWFVGSAIDLASAHGISERVTGLTIVSVGTSLPELVTSLVAALRRNSDIAVGNVIGSNLFNLLGVLGISAMIQEQPIPNRMLAVDVPLMLVATIALLPIVRSGGRIARGEGALLLGGYLVFVAWLLLGA